MVSYTVYLRERHIGKDGRNARDALSLLRSAGVDLDVERDRMPRIGWPASPDGLFTLYVSLRYFMARSTSGASVH